MSYQHTQAGTMNRVIIGALIAAHPKAGEVFWAAVVALALSLALAARLLRRRFAIEEIQRVQPLRTRWWYGWGIRLTPHGWLFNVSGFDAVKIELGNGKKYLIGTDEPKKLAAAIESAMARRG